jgi:hypothetical protein
MSRIEPIRLVDPNPRHFLPPPRQLIAAPRELFLRLEQVKPRCQPFFTCSSDVGRHLYLRVGEYRTLRATNVRAL